MLLILKSLGWGQKVPTALVFAHSMRSKSAFIDFQDCLRILNQLKFKFSKANLGYLDTFFGGMLESKFALNNLNFKCYIQFFFVRAQIGPKKWGGQFDPPHFFGPIRALTLKN